MLSKLIDQLGDNNPQLFRELKGRLKTKNLAITGIVSLVLQSLIYFYYQCLLPSRILGIGKQYNRYCQENTKSHYNNLCFSNGAGDLIINWQIWWLDLFICISVTSIIAFLVIGCYLLISDLSREQNRDTLGFIRLSPQSASSILLGKLLGVPILLYFASVLVLPLHLIAGLKANIPLISILTFDAVLAASAIFFYSLALLYALVTSRLGGFQAWLGCGFLLFALCLLSGASLSIYQPLGNSADWLRLFYPGTVLSYLVAASSIDPSIADYFRPESLIDLTWYNLRLWVHPKIGAGIIILNYALWTFWTWLMLKRRFHNQNVTVFSKQHSYWLSTTTIATICGFAVQKSIYSNLFTNFRGLMVFNLILFLGLIAALSTSRQTLHDWARYRHKVSALRRNLVKDLIWGEKSPALVAIAINLVITSIVMLPVIIFLPFAEYRVSALLGLLLNASLILIYGTVVQMILLFKSRKQGIWAVSLIVTMIVLPLGIFALFKVDPELLPNIWLLSAFPIVSVEYATLSAICFSLLGQGLIIAIANWKMTQHLQKLGMSSTKVLMTQNT